MRSKSITNFMFYFFEPIKFGKIINQIDQNLCDANELRDAYLVWVFEFCRKSLLFYQNQYRAHSDTTWLKFCSTFKIPDYEHPTNFDLEFEWGNWKEEYLLNEHYKAYQETIHSLSSLQDATSKEIEASIVLPTGSSCEKEFNKIWFNDLIGNLPEETTELRSLSYERYLQTPHWKKIRAAMFLINKATCQANDCNEVGESWYGGAESDLEVHHLSYKNRGNERFDDLALLCRHHHELIHHTLNKNDEFSDNVDGDEIFTE